MEIESSLPRFPDPEKLICHAKKKILKVLRPLPLPIFIPYYKKLRSTVTQNNRQHYISVYFNFYVFG
jgi:hypothetical protein